MHRPWRIGILGIGVALLISCASSGGARAADRVEPPRMTSRNAPPALSISSMSVSGRSPLRVDVEVMIDETGRPVMSTFKVSGMGAPDNQEALREWIENASYRPAHRDGMPVPGLFKAHVEVEVRRIS